MTSAGRRTAASGLVALLIGLCPLAVAAEGAGAGSSGGHWAFQPLKRPVMPPAPGTTNPIAPIDRFILQKLRAAGLSPAPPADKRTLIRRATFDLIGLPPAPEEIDAFLNDPSPSAFEKVVDRLLGTPQFAERWARHWLDVARYADSNGLEGNTPYDNAWRYRDYVVKSFHEDKPFNRFIREQIAGDLLPYSSDEQRYEQLTATGFLMLGPKAFFEPNQTKLILDVTDEQIDVTTKAFLGLTVSCARCHDHKYDPIPTRDYYALAGIFRSTATLDFGQGPAPANPAPRRWIERPLAPPEVAKVIEDYNAKLNEVVESLRAAAQAKMELPGGVSSARLEGIVQDNTAAILTGMWKESFYAERFVDKNYIHDGNTQKGQKTARFVTPLPEAGYYEVLFAYNPHFNRATNVPVTIQSAEGSRTVLVNQTLPPPIEGVFASLGTFRFDAGTNHSVIVSNEGTKGFVVVDAVRFVPRDNPAMAGGSMTMMTKSAASSPQKAAASSPAAPALSYEELENRYLTLRENAPPPMPMAMAVQEGSPQDSPVYIRGEPDRPGEVVPRGFLTAVRVSGKAEPPRIPAESSGRLGLADWIASEQNPLTARVAVNRIWLYLFGKGLVDTPDNFGALTEKPVHAELLDYLAWQFIENGWSVKKTIRTIMLSDAYRRSSAYDPAAYNADPDNTLLWRMDRRRLDAEAIRDSILALSGELDLTMGGTLAPSSSAPLDVPAILNPELARNRRRSIYLPVLRNNITDFFEVFDFPNSYAVAGKRHTTTAAPQALFMMNSPFILDQSQKWAEALLRDHPLDRRQRIERAYVQAFGRPPTMEEQERAAGFLAAFENECRIAGLSEPESTAWQSFCQSLFASTEFRFLD